MEPARDSGAAVPAACPSCGQGGFAVGSITLKALLTSSALARLGPGAYRFCPAPACDVVYFGCGEPFRCGDVQVPVFQKQAPGDRIVCYCFDVEEQRIVREAEASGTSATCARIQALVRAERCACELRNPRGGCCLGDLMALARTARSALEEGPAGAYPA